MKLQDQVCTLEQAKKLRELGVSCPSCFSWCGDEQMRLMDNGREAATFSNWLFVSPTEPYNNEEADYRSLVPSSKPIAPAYTVAELGVMMPDGDREREPYCTHAVDGAFGEEGRQWFASILVVELQKGFKTEAEARAAMIVFLLETKLITAAEVNARL